MPRRSRSPIAIWAADELRNWSRWARFRIPGGLHRPGEPSPSYDLDRALVAEAALVVLRARRPDHFAAVHVAFVRMYEQPREQVADELGVSVGQFDRQLAEAYAWLDGHYEGRWPTGRRLGE